MKDLDKLNLGIYEKALPKDIDWVERIKLVKECGYDFVEISIDETDERLARLDWSDDEIERIILGLREINKNPFTCDIDNQVDI